MNGYSVSTVSKLTGISTATLRVWEARYEVVTPSRKESGHREYSEADIERLRLIQELIDHGERIGNIAYLEEEDLRQRISKFEESEQPDSCGSSRPRFFVVSADPSSAARLLAAAGAERRSSADSLPSAWAQLQGTVLDCGLLLDVDAVIDAEADLALKLARLAPGHPTILLCRNIPSRLVKGLRLAGVEVLRRPVSSTTLRELLADRHGDSNRSPAETNDQEEIPAPIYDRQQLQRVAALPSSISCECPHHLAEILASLNAFEEYSANCEDRSDEDAELHSYLRRVTGSVRVTMEQALARTLEAENLNPDAL